MYWLQLVVMPFYTLQLLHFYTPSNCVHEILLRTIKYGDAEQQQDHHKPKAVAEVVPFKGAFAQEAVLEGLDHGSHRVEHAEPLVFFGDGAEGIDYRGSVHGQLHAKL